MDRTEAYEQVKKALEFYAGATAITVSRTEISGSVGSTLTTTRDGTQATKALEYLRVLKPPAEQQSLPNSYDEAKALGWNCSPLTWEAVRESVRKAQQRTRGAEVERVARALAVEDYRQKQRGDYNDADTFASRHWGKYQPEARVAIAALSHPVPTLEYEVIGYTGSGSVSSLAYGGEGHIWAKPGDAHPLPVYGPKGMLSEKRQT